MGLLTLSYSAVFFSVCFACPPDYKLTEGRDYIFISLIMPTTMPDEYEPLNKILSEASFRDGETRAAQWHEIFTEISLSVRIPST